MPKDEFETLVLASKTYVEILKGLNYSPRGGAFRILKERILKEQIDDSHILRGSAQSICVRRPAKSDDEIFITNSTYLNGRDLKKRLIKNGLKDVCQKCNLPNVWNNEPISLQVDHINGIRDDNRVENLRILCPNCHSQTDNFAGRNCRIKPNKCKCGSKISGYAKNQKCQSCANRELGQKHRKVQDRPTKEELEKMLWEMPTTSIAKIYDVSDKAVEKWAKSYDITKPPRGYWAKQKLRP